jgi:spermidine synthase
MEVVDHNGIRSLYFLDAVVQSRMSLQKPHRLILKYTRYMMAAALLTVPAPAKILLIGVGAGSFLHFFDHFFPESSEDGVDYSEHVLAIARGYFFLPENHKITVHCNDGFRFLAGRHASHDYDLILIDAFNDHGMARNIYSHDFFRLAREHLADDGIICANLWSGDAAVFNSVQKGLRKNAETCLFIPVRERENVIALLLQRSTPWEQICPPAAVLDQLSSLYGFDFNEVSASTRKNNMKLAEKMRFLFG